LRVKVEAPRMVLPQHSGRVYKHRGKDNWKETWLCLETDGTLTWKKKDAYEVKGVAYLKDILENIQISGWSTKKCEQNKNATPFLMNLPIEVHGSKKNKTLIVKSGADLDLWLDAFATVIGKWKLWKACKQWQASKISKQKSIDERSVEQQLKYEELVEFYKITWSEFLASYKKNEPIQNGDTNGQVQNGNLRQLDSANGASSSPSNSEQLSRPPSYGSTMANHAKQPQTNEVIASVTVHKEVNVVNGIVQPSATVAGAKQKTNTQIYGEEDGGDELHF